MRLVLEALAFVLQALGLERRDQRLGLLPGGTLCFSPWNPISGEALAGMGRETVPAGATLVLETAGGGGLGEPAEREAGAQDSDRKAGYVSG